MKFHKKYPELLQDESFLRWRLLSDAETDAYWDNLQKQYPELKEEVLLADVYLKKHVFKKASLTPVEKTALFTRIQQSLHQTNKQKSYFIWIKYIVAACFIVGMGLLFFHKEKNLRQSQEVIEGYSLAAKDIQLITSNGSQSFGKNISIKIAASGVAQIQEKNRHKTDIRIDQTAINKLVVPYGKRSFIELSDGTKVWLNSGSSLEFPTRFADNIRKIRLSGEMYIEVAHDKAHPFYVQASGLDVRVTGTAFNLSAYENETQSLVLVDGSVRLKSNNSEMDVLPGQIAICTPSRTLEKEVVDVNKYASWKDGYILFEKTPIPVVLKYIERYYNLSFSYGSDTNLRQSTCSGKLYLSEDVDNVMKSIALLSATSYKKENHIIYITNNPK